MADTNTNVKFFTGSLEKYNELSVKDPMGIYFVTDENTGKSYLYKGEQLYGTDAVASSAADGMMSKEDKASLDKLVEEGIDVKVPEYSMEKQETAEEGYVATYKLKRTLDGESTYVGDPINIPDGSGSVTILDKTQNLTEDGTLSSDYITQGDNTLILDGGSAPTN